MKWNELSPEHSTLYKGVAIFMIVIHNFMHLLPGPKELEFKFKQHNFIDFFQALYTEPERFFQFFMSFFGHFGVQIFIFLSAYGLTKKYLSKKPDYIKFIISRFYSIYPAFLITIVIWTFVMALHKFTFDGGALGYIKLIYWHLENNFVAIFYKLTLVSNFFPEQRLNLVGPWWFISLIFQFYLVFPLMFWCSNRWGGKFLIALTLSAIGIMILSHGIIGDVLLSYIVVGHLPELCLGIALAMRDKKSVDISWFVFLLAFVFYVLGNLFEPLWYLTHICFLLLMLFAFNGIIPFIEKSSLVQRVVVFFGVFSMPIFLVNGFLRYPFVDYAKDANSWSTAIGYCLVSLSLTIAVSILLFHSEKYFKMLISARRTLSRPT